MEILSDTVFRGKLTVDGLTQLDETHLFGDLIVCGSPIIRVNYDKVVTEPEIQNFPTIHRFRNPAIPAGCTSFAFVTLDGSEGAAIEGKYFDVNGSYGGVSEFFFTNVLDTYAKSRSGIPVSIEIEQQDETPSGGGYSRKSFIGHIASQSSDISGGRYSLLVLG